MNDQTNERAEAPRSRATFMNDQTNERAEAPRSRATFVETKKVKVKLIAPVNHAGVDRAAGEEIEVYPDQIPWLEECGAVKPGKDRLRPVPDKTD